MHKIMVIGMNYMEVGTQLHVIWELIYMNRIQKAFDEKKKVFIGFVTAGDPNLATTKELVRAMIKGGAGPPRSGR